MKKLIFTLLFVGGTLLGFSQGKYYWVGGANGVWATGTSWNTALDGSGSSRTNLATDTLIFDGSNIGGVVPATGPVSPVTTGGITIAQLKLQNAADVTLQRTGTSGTLTMLINGDVAPSGGSDDLTVDATSKLSLTSTITSYSFVLQLGVAGTNVATGNILGNVSTIDGGFGSVRIGVQNAGALSFAAGSVFTSNNTTSGSSSFGTSAQGAAYGVTFKAGSTLIYKGGNSFWSTTSTYQSTVFERGSTAAFEGSASSVNGLFNSRTYANVIIRNNATITLGDNFYNIDTLTINAGATFNLRPTGTAPISGNIINNGTFGAAAAYTTTHLLFDGTVPQSITGSGTFNGLAAVSVATDADVTSYTNLNIGSTTIATSPPTSTITGKLNVQNNTISSTGTALPGPVSIKSSATATTISGCKLTAGINTDTLASAAVYAAANIGIGNLVTGTGIPPNTYIIATSSANNVFTMSKAATQSILAGTITISNTGGTFATSNTGGIDGSLTTTGTKSFGASSNYVFNTATTTPFSTSGTGTMNDVTFNAAATTNKLITVNGALTLNSGKLTIRPVDTVRIAITGSIAGSFDATKYIATDVSGANVGVLRIDSFTTAKTFPVGTPNYYMPVTLTPTTVSTFCVSLFQGITNEGTSNGTAFTAGQKSGVVDAVWTLNRTTSNTTDNCTVNVTWPSVLEGAVFPTYGNNIGIARHDGIAWTTVAGSGDNTLNTATNIFSSFSPFGVGQLNTILPIKLFNFSAKTETGKVKLQWNISEEGNTGSYIIERSVNGTLFNSIATITAMGSNLYSGNDANPSALNYYRIKIINKNGSFEYSNILKVKLQAGQSSVSVFPNPVKDKVLNLQLDNFAAGKVLVKLYNDNGQLLLDNSIQYNGGSQVQAVQLPSSITKGVYRLVVNINNEVIRQSVIVQ